MSTPWFFLSYASISQSHDRLVKQFFLDLADAVRVAAGLKEGDVPEEEIGFCAEQLSAGKRWPPELCRKLSSCRVLVCLYSSAYFKSLPCGQEFEIFRNRLNDYIRDNGVEPPDLIIPVIWVKNFDEKLLPKALKEIHYEDPGFEEEANQNGIYHDLAIHGNKSPKYLEYVHKLAGIIKDAASLEPALPPLTNAFEFKRTVNAFAGYPGAPTQADEVLEDASESQTKLAQIDFSATQTVTTRPIPVHWYIIVATALVITASLTFKFRCSLSPRLCWDLAISQEFTDPFERKPQGSSGWLKDDDWEYPVQSWSLVPGRDEDDTDRALLVKGETPGFTKKAFDDFEATFIISHVEGTNAGWFLRAQKKDGQISGYRFVLQELPDNKLFLHASAEGTPPRKISPPGCNVFIYEYKKKPDDDIEVVVKAIGNEITYSFKLGNPDSQSLPDSKPVGCSEPFKVESTSFIDAGYIGFFADAKSSFKVEELSVLRKK
jgi:hypothetical protein